MKKKWEALLICVLVSLIVNTETGCRAKSCPAYGDDTPERGALFKRKKNKAKGGLFTKKQRRYYKWHESLPTIRNNRPGLLSLLQLRISQIVRVRCLSQTVVQFNMRPR